MKVYTLTLLFVLLAGTEGVNVNKADKAYIVNRHNELRRDVEPTASNMLQMSWSAEAAANAENWANKCIFEESHSADRNINSSGCGENLAMANSSHTESSWETVIQMWYDEGMNWEYGLFTGTSVDGKMVGHFTQIVWYRSNLIGCAVAHCPEATHKYFYVCHYCSPGNVMDTYPYKSGTACGDCPNDCVDHLCTQLP